MSNICSSCGTAVSDKAKFCHVCGSKIAVITETFCPECGTKNPADYKFCMECGERLVTSEESTKISDAATDAEGWDDTLTMLSAVEEEISLSPFNYEKRPDGSVVITGLRDKYAMHIEVPSCVSAIGAEAFAHSNIITIILPNGLTAIDRRSFYGCASLSELNIPESVLMIGDEAFAECAKLDISIPGTVRIIGKYPLRGTLPEIRAREAEERAQRERREKGRAKAERRERERVAKEKAEKERKERENAAYHAKIKKQNDDLAAAGDPMNHTNPQRYGFSGVSGEDSLKNYQIWNVEGDKSKFTQATIALAKGYYFGSFGFVDKNRAMNQLRCIIEDAGSLHDPRYIPGVQKLLSAMDNGTL